MYAGLTFLLQKGRRFTSTRMWYHTYTLYSNREIRNTYPSTCNILHIELGEAGSQAVSQSVRQAGRQVGGWVG